MNVPLDRALKFLCWLGLICQAVGIVSAISLMAIGQFDGGAASIVVVVFGMAVGGWAGNLLEIRHLKGRVAALEGREPAASTV
jgi:hypothetical protein